MPGFTVEIKPPFWTVKHKFQKVNKETITEKRKMIQELGRKWVELARAEAPKGKTGKFRKGIHFKTFVNGNIVELRTYSPSPLGGWIAYGTRPHVIRAKKANALFFYWPKVGAPTFVPKKGFPVTGMLGGYFWIGKGFVNHPGTKANPYHERATKKWRRHGYTALRKIALNYKTRITQ